MIATESSRAPNTPSGELRGILCAWSSGHAISIRNQAIMVDATPAETRSDARIDWRGRADLLHLIQETMLIDAA